MARKSKGTLSRRTRNLSRHFKGQMRSVDTAIIKYNIGDMVAIVPGANAKNIPHPRYKGKIGEIVEKRGSSYLIKLKIMNATKTLVVPPIHLKYIGKKE
jgi:large subunit ribosomal protein L21e